LQHICTYIPHKYVCTIPSRRKKKPPQHEIACQDDSGRHKDKGNRNRIETAESQIATTACYFLSISHSLLDSSHQKIMRISFCSIPLERHGYQGKNSPSNSEDSFPTSIAVGILGHKRRIAAVFLPFMLVSFTLVVHHFFSMFLLFVYFF